MTRFGGPLILCEKKVDTENAIGRSSSTMDDLAHLRKFQYWTAARPFIHLRFR